MTSAFYGPNCLGIVKSERELLDYYGKWKPAWGLFLESAGLARQAKTASPTTNIILRVGYPDGTWVKQDPAKLLAHWRTQIGIEDFWVYADNEQGIAPDWHINLIKQNALSVHPLKLVIGNLSVGTPQPEEWRTAKVLELLRLCNQYRAWVVWACHEYYNIVPTSGFIGGYPDNAGLQPNLQAAPGTPPGRNLIPVANWPAKAEADRLAKFHVGRFNFILQACQEAGIPPPRLVITECGQDDVSDIKDWVLKNFGEGLRGFQTALPIWRKLYPQWTDDEAYPNMLSYLAHNVYAGTPVEGALFFCYGRNGDPMWEQFNVEGREGLLNLTGIISIEKPAPVVEVKPTPTPLPTQPPQIPPPTERPTVEAPQVPATPPVEALQSYRMQIVTYKVVNLPPSAAQILIDAGVLLEPVSV